MLQVSAQWTREQLGRVAAAYVAGREVEGHMVMVP